MYRGKDPKTGEQCCCGSKVLVGQLINKGHVGYVDCYYTNAAFAEELKKVSICLAGTLIVLI
jgi:hypothetical protein